MTTKKTKTRKITTSETGQETTPSQQTEQQTAVQPQTQQNETSAHSQTAMKKDGADGEGGVDIQAGQANIYEQVKKEEVFLSKLQELSASELVKMAKKEGLGDLAGYPKQDIIFRIIQKKAEAYGLLFCEGVLEIIDKEGYGFIRSAKYNYVQSNDDVYVSQSQIRRFGMRTGNILVGQVRPQKQGEKYLALLKVEAINYKPPEEQLSVPLFENLTPLHPNERIVLETEPDELNMRIFDIVSPIGKGQRGLIVSPPRAGKTVLLQKIANAILHNYKDIYVIVLLIDERPEEVTDFKRNLKGRPSQYEVIASCFDEPPEHHRTVAEMVLAKAKRMVEHGQDVVIVLDSITRMTRAYNNLTPHSGRILSGGIDAQAFKGPKSFFGAARKIEEGGSLTIIATALVDTGSRMDEVIYEEFKGTGNMELHLDRSLADRRIWPAIEITRSGTRREELLMNPDELRLTWMLRRYLYNLKSNEESILFLKEQMKRYPSNAQFLMELEKRLKSS